MNQKQTMKKLCGEELLKKYIALLEKSCEDFVLVELTYKNSCIQLKKKFKYMDEIIECNNNMIISKLEYSYEKGLCENLEHFANPNLPTFLDNNYDYSLNEKQMREKVDFVQAYTDYQKLIKLLPNEILAL